MTTVINLYGGPGTGKSTTAAHLFALFKQEGRNVELVTEYAKDKVWEKSFDVLGNQVYVLGKQYHRMYRLLGKTDYIITDSPLLFSLYYGKHLGDNFKNLVLELYRSMDNIDIFLTRVKKYELVGRMQTEEQARLIDGEIKYILNQNNISHQVIAATKHAANDIFSCLNGVETWLR